MSEILTGRALDAAVAERVMGWARGTKPGDSPWYPPGAGRYTGGGRLGTPEYSTDIAAAWHVVTRYGLTVGPWGKGWFAGHAEDGDADFWDLVAFAETPQEAICLAGLKCAAMEASHA